MCDIILAPPAASASGGMLFGKNSDRQPNEAQIVELSPGANHPEGATVTTTYLTIAQVARTHAVLLCRPFWIWGAEMGANEHGVVIGNEGVHARTPAPQTPALIGMDLIRLGLERAATAEQAVDVITTLLHRHGQGGNCGHEVPSYYNNSFMIADARDAFVLETVGRDWLVENVEGVRALSNGYSIDRDVSRTSAELPALLRSYGFDPDSVRDYSAAITDPARSHISSAGARRARATSLLATKASRLSALDMMRILRDHDLDGQYPDGWHPRLDVPFSLCIHAGTRARNAHTTGALVSEIRDTAPVHWVTATAAPCLSIFKPVLMDVAIPSHGAAPTGRFDAGALWWQHEQWHRRALLGDFSAVLQAIGAERDALEAGFHARVNAVLNGGDAADRASVIAACWREALAAQHRWRSMHRPASLHEDSDFAGEWRRLNDAAGSSVSRE